MNILSIRARERLVAVVSTLAAEKRNEIERLKQEYCGLTRSDFIWHYLLQSFSTMGRASGWHGLIGKNNNYQRITYNALAALTPEDRGTEVREVCRKAGIRMPDKKADYILGCFDYVKRLGGLESTKSTLLAQPGREGKIRFLQTFPGIGPKYARNIMMDVYHEDFRDSIALDVRIKAISDSLGLSFSSYTEHESFYLSVAKDAGLNGWELDRLLFNFRPEVESRLGTMHLLADWKCVLRDAATDAPITYDPDTDLYDPNDPAQVQNFFASVKVVRKPGRPKAETTKTPTAILLSSDVVEYFKSTGAGWQSRIDAALRDWMAGHPLKRT